MNKICTDLGQSKKLVEILPIETADMCISLFTIITNGNKEMKQVLVPLNYSKVTEYPAPDFIERFPAWSLSALLGLMPKLFEFENDPDDGGCQPNLCKGWDNNLWHVVYRSSIYITEWHEDPIDAAYEMIVWLKENDKI